MPHDPLVKRDARQLERVGVAVIALRGGGDRHPVAEIADPPVTGGQQVVDRADRARPVVGHHGVRVEQARFAVDEDQAGAGLAFPEQVAVVPPGRHDQQSVHPAVEERARQPALAVGVLVQAAEQGQHASLARRVLDGSQQQRGEGVSRVLDERADRRGAPVAAAQVARREVRPIAEPVGRRIDPRHKPRVDRAHAVDHARDGLEGDPGQRRHVAHGGPGGRARRIRIWLSHRCLPTLSCY